MRTLLLLACALCPAAARAAPEPPVDFARDVRPILSSQCFQCHGPDEKARKAKLRLDVREEALRAGAFVPGKPDASEIITRICTTEDELRMPPAKLKKPPLTGRQIATLKRWVAEGAKYSDHWAFAQLTRPAVPDVGPAARNAIDRFILARLAAEQVAPAKEADRVTLIRRLSFDLTGLPPTPEEVRAFVNDKAPDAYEKRVDKLLASPHFGERMAVWWLDLVRYADSIGYHSDNPMNVSPYRDYVIRSFNENKPFDQFTVEQLAGDLLPNATLQQKVASAYNRLLQTTEEGGAQAKEYIAKYSADRVRNYGQVWLGGTLMCAECHNHKFDPYTQADFYAVAAFFADIQEPAVGGRGPGTLVPDSAEQEARLAKLINAVSRAQAELVSAAKKYADGPKAFDDIETWAAPKGAKKDTGVPADVKAALAKPASGRTPAESERLVSFARDNAPALKAERDAVTATMKAKADFENGIPRVLMTQSGPPRTVRVLPRGNWLDDSGPEVKPNTPTFLPPLPPPAAGQSRYTRLDLARWTVSPENPLTARATANRLWRLFFGYGIARSLEETGVQGELPTHPELLDWLASEFQAKWDVKGLVRLMVLSSAYRQSSAETPDVRERDPMNKLFARQTRQRLDAEFIRDTALRVSGLLNPQVGGASVKPYQPAGYWAALNFPAREWQKDAGDKVYRRGMYTHWQRSFPHPAMVAFDAPSREECTCDRAKSNIPQQALVLLNDPEFVEAANAFAAKTLREGGAGDGARTAWAFERATGRVPKPEEVQVLTGVLNKHRRQFAAKPDEAKKLLAVGDAAPPNDAKPEELAAWVSVCRVVLNLHETITRP
ncbi:PSD1 and planctomycete cytochrome C domain-containing protein [Gemmata sp. JC717]|uniref:PSD1 and planctomycete cytochrome C domain-containing protein n=1 Tax=Gemmata algarum TaxID=2975278 RepID=UPI0021BB0AA3|nr:PSD1 and planctomycete cytochrome C domain-containing protein [Gemmata algarum]MDY3553859.1 PSD1 and planctomycete cytochrome C domain-containing protein [Gemmata algarum]